MPPDEPYDPQKHGPLPTAAAAAPAEQPYDPAKHGALPVYQPSTGQGDPDQPSAMDRPADVRGVKPIAEDVLTRMASSLSFGTAEKAKAIIHSTLGEGAYDQLLAKYREETQQAGDRLGPVGQFFAEVAGGALTGKAAADVGLTILGKLPAGASLAQKVIAGMQEGGIYGALQGAGHTDTGKLQDYVKNTLIGGGWGALVGGGLTGATAGVQKVITPFPITDPERKAAMQTLTDAGVDVSAGTKVGSPRLRLAEDITGKSPLGGPALNDDQMAQVTQKVMQKAGIGGGGKATPDVLDKGFDTVGGKIGAISDQYHTGIDNQALTEAANVAQKLPLLKSDAQGSVQYFLDKIVGSQTLPNGQRILGGKTSLPPDEAQAVRTQLVQAIRDENGPNGNKALQRALGDVKDMLDDALTRTIQGAGNHGDVAALQEARNQYAHLHILADALGSSGGAGMRGELTPSALASAVQRSVGKKDFFRGAGDLNDLARASAGYLQPPKDSYTSTREGYRNPMAYVMGLLGRLGVNSRGPLGGAQGYWGNQATSPPSGGLLQPGVTGGAAGVANSGTGAAGDNSPGPADRLVQGLLMGGR